MSTVHLPASSLAASLGALVLSLPAVAQPESPPAPPTTASVLEASTPDDWRALDPERTLRIEFGDARVVIELAPDFAPAHVDNIRALARAGWFDGAHITRSQDNYVAQWGRTEEALPGPRGEARDALPAEFDRAAEGLPHWQPLDDGDVYAPEVGWVAGFPVARDPGDGRAWLAHCYGMVGAGRGMAAGSSDGGQLYVVTGHSPRHLDRNITQVGRVVAGIEHLSTLPRGTGPLGFYESADERVPLTRAVIEADLPEGERSRLELLRTDSDAFAELVRARRHRHEDWFIDTVGRVELCNVPLPVREREPD